MNQSTLCKSGCCTASVEQRTQWHNMHCWRGVPEAAGCRRRPPADGHNPRSIATRPAALSLCFTRGFPPFRQRDRLRPRMHAIHAIHDAWLSACRGLSHDPYLEVELVLMWRQRPCGPASPSGRPHFACRKQATRQHQSCRMLHGICVLQPTVSGMTAAFLPREAREAALDLPGCCRRRWAG